MDDPFENIQFTEQQRQELDSITEALSLCTPGGAATAIQQYRDSSLRSEIGLPPDIEEAAANCYAALLKGDDLSADEIASSIELKESFSIPQQLTQPLAEDAYCRCIEKGDLEFIVMHAEALVGDFNANGDKILEAVKRAYQKASDKGDLESIIPMTRFFKYTPNLEIEEVKSSKEFNEATVGQLCTAISQRSTSFAIEMIYSADLNLPGDILKRPEVEQAKIDGMKFWLLRDRSDQVEVMLEHLSPTVESLANSELRQEAADFVIRAISTGNMHDAVFVEREFSLQGYDYEDSELQGALKSGALHYLNEGKGANAAQLLNHFPEHQADIVAQPDFQQCVIHEHLIPLISSGDAQAAFDAIDSFGMGKDFLSTIELEPSIQKGFIAAVSHLGHYQAEFFREAFAISDKLLESEAVQLAVENRVLQEMQSTVGEPGEWIESFANSPDMREKLSVAQFVETCLRGTPEKAFENLEELVGKVDLNAPFPDPGGGTQTYERQFLIACRENFGVHSWRELSEFLSEQRSYLSQLRSAQNIPALTTESIAAASNLHINISHADEIARNGANVVELEKNKDYDRALDYLTEYSRPWQSDTARAGLKIGRNTFGSEKILRITYALDSVSRTLFNFPEIVALQESSGISPSKFYGQVLQQVASDTAIPQSERMFTLRNVASTVGRTREEVLESYDLILALGDGDASEQAFPTPESAFESWSKLKRFNALALAARDPRTRKILQELSDVESPKLKTFVKTLAYHKTSRVSIQDITEFWRRPGDFLSRDDDHAHYAAHHAKKPSNYLDIFHLDLNAEDVRDCLVEGHMDRIQVFPPMEVKYKVFVLENSNLTSDVFSSVREMTNVALGSFREKREGMAKAPKKLFGELNTLLKGECTAVEYVRGKKIPPDLEAKVSELVRNDNTGMEVTEVTATAKVNLKSDPHAVLAGDDTVCCMPFGSGKNSVYMFNLNTGLFTFELDMPVGKMRTIAQSVLTKDLDIGKSIPAVVRELQFSPDKPLSEVLPEDLLSESKRYLAADNIEVAPNFQRGYYESLVETLYGDFFKRYLKKHGEAEGLEQDFIPIGVGYSDAFGGLEHIPNSFAPQAPVSYSDKTGLDVLRLGMDRDTSAVIAENVVGVEVSRLKRPAISTAGVDHLTFEDSLGIAYIEGKAYAENPSLMVHLHNLENTLIAKDMCNTMKDRPNMSFKYSQDGKLIGYVLAYEGKLKTNEVVNADKPDEDVIYIADMAAKNSFSAGGKLIHAFLDQYKANYLDRGKSTPILGQFREGTSYRLLQRKLDKMSLQLGVKFEVERIQTKTVGSDKMHTLLVRPVGKLEEFQEAA